MTETVTVLKADLAELVLACLKHLPDDLDADVRRALNRLMDARHQDIETEAELEEDPRPDGFWGRAEIPGMRNHTGWITEETRFGTQLAVVRDWDGRVIAEMGIGPACRVLHLPTPLKRPEPPKAITTWDGERDDDEDLDDDDEPPTWRG